MLFIKQASIDHFFNDKYQDLLAMAIFHKFQYIIKCCYCYAYISIFSSSIQMTYLKILLTKIIKNKYKEAFIWSAKRFIWTILLLLVMLLKHPKTGYAVEILCLLSLHMLRGIPYIRKVIPCWLKKSSFKPVDAKVTRFYFI